MLLASIENNPLIGGKHRNEFAEDVLNILKRRKVTFRNCQPDYVSIFLNGKVKVWFYGYRDGRPWRGGVGYNCILPQDKVFMADPSIVAEMCARHIALMNAG